MTATTSTVFGQGPPQGETVVARDGGREQEGQDEALVLRPMVEEDRILAEEILDERRREPHQHLGGEEGQKGERGEHGPQIDEALFREQPCEDAPRVEQERADDLGHGAAEVGVAPEMRIRLPAEVGDEPPRVHHEEAEGADGGDGTPPPAPPRHGQPQPEAHHGDGRVLAGGEDEKHGDPVQPRSLRLDEVDGGEEERDGEGG